ncbi:hypothetical protein DSCA_10650 [Desulfosarcina alkanivorans]|jgi:hypothetical protein|uniref:CULT domain-containing protein n=1 Tax=Desulfosarcina alkanivorans TaxID=571177 RepID=A0A5K7YF92_9BACT|nr:cereblon family protein [Desulfosarcina alkanivorans]BBO67135.1 hypothetical protein DSCA_10650 [Desulfosarcina alkanivorans]
MTMNGTIAKGDGRGSLSFLPHPVVYLFRPDPKPETTGGEPVGDPEDRTVAATRPVIVCRQCLHEITSHDQRKEVNGAHVHSFANPEGIIFEIACYREAWGCGYLGPSSPEFTWFAGYVWRIGVCANCHVHLGWRFSAPDGHFFHGLITSRLMSTGG